MKTFKLLSLLMSILVLLKCVPMGSLANDSETITNSMLQSTNILVDTPEQNFEVAISDDEVLTEIVGLREENVKNIGCPMEI